MISCWYHWQLYYCQVSECQKIKRKHSKNMKRLKAIETLLLPWYKPASRKASRTVVVTAGTEAVSLWQIIWIKHLERRRSQPAEHSCHSSSEVSPRTTPAAYYEKAKQEMLKSFPRSMNSRLVIYLKGCLASARCCCFLSSHADIGKQVKSNLFSSFQTSQTS